MCMGRRKTLPISSTEHFFTFKVIKVKKYIICKKCIPMEFVKIDKISSKAFTALVANKTELI